MIEPTDDMKMAAYRAARAWADEHRGHQQPDDRMIQAAVEAALAIVERDYRIKPRRKPSWRDAPGCLCAPTGRPYRLCPVHGEAAS